MELYSTWSYKQNQWLMRWVCKETLARRSVMRSDITLENTETETAPFLSINAVLYYCITLLTTAE